jgi:exonuclease-1
MGITGLWPLLKAVTRPGHIKQYARKRVAVDTYAWLHKAVYGCCVELATGIGSEKWLSYCLEFVDLLLSHGIEVWLVFDGGKLIGISF